MRLFHWFKVRIRLGRVEDFVAVHHRHEVLGVGEIDDVVRVAGKHVDRLDVVAGDFELDDLVGAELAFLNQTMPRDHDKELPLGIMPMLPLRNPGLGDVNGDLAAVKRVNQLRERAAVVNVHLQRESDLLLREIAQIGRIQLLREAPRRNLRNHQRRRLRCERIQQIHNLAQRSPVRRRHVAILAVLNREHAQAVEVAAVLLATEAGDYLVHKVVDVQEFQLNRRVIDLIRQVVRDGIAEGCDRGIVIRPAPLAEQVREPVHQHPGARVLAVLEEQVLPGFLAAAVLGIPETPRQRRLLAARQHHRANVLMLPEGVQECRCKSEVPAHELAGILRPVHPREIEHEVRLRAPTIQFLGRGIEVVFIYFRDGNTVIAGFAVPDVFQLSAEVSAYEAFSAGDKYLHY